MLSPARMQEITDLVMNYRSPPRIEMEELAQRINVPFHELEEWFARTLSLSDDHDVFFESQ